MSRWYAPAYQNDNGNIIPCGSATVVAEHAHQAAEALQQQWQKADPRSPDVFVATREMPDWERASPPDSDPITFADTCCGKCPFGTCYVDQMTGA